MSLLRKLIPLQRELFLFACLAGIIPAFVTNTIFTSAAFPGVESFRWTYFDLGVAKYVYVLVFVAAFTLGILLRKRSLLLAVIPLLALVVTPVGRIGAVSGYDLPLTQEATATDWRLQAERAAIARLGEPPDALDALLSELPPALPNTAWLEAKLPQVDAARRAAVDSRAKYEAQLPALNASIALLQSLRDPRNSKIAAAIEASEAPIRKIAADMNSKVSAAQLSAISALADLRTKIRLHENWVAEKRATYLEALYVLSSALLLLYFVWKFGVGNWVMAGFLVLAAVASLWSASREWADDWLLYALASLYPVFIGALVILVVRVLFRAVHDNREIWHSFSRAELGRASSWALLLWSPFAVALTLNYMAGEYAYNAVSERIYCERMDLKGCVPPSRAMVQDSDPSRDTLREDLHATVERLYADFEERAFAMAANAKSGAPAAIGKVRQDLLGAFNSIIKPNIWDYESGPRKGTCSLFNLKACATNIVLDIVNAAYRRPRNGMYSALDSRVTAAANAAKGAAKAGAEGFQSAIRNQAAAASRETRKHVDAVLLGVAGISAFGSAVLLLVSVRALLLIFARLLFAQNRTMFTTITHREQPLAPDAPRADATVPQGDKLQIDLRDEVLLVNRRFDVTGAAPDTRWRPPQPLRWPIRRILKRCYWVKEIDARAEPKPIELQSTHGAHFFNWSIPAGSEVAFQWDTFVGVSETVALKKTFSLKLGTLVLGHVMIPTARGPGLLLQRAYGKANQDQKAVSPARLLSWELGTGFRVESSARKRSVYVDYCQIMKDDSGTAVYDAPREGAGGRGIWWELVGLFRL